VVDVKKNDVPTSELEQAHDFQEKVKLSYCCDSFFYSYF
jgi:hypothetical protein